MPPLTLLIFFGVLGSAFGSFGNVLVIRLADRRRITGRSRCPHCQRVIAWHDLIPIVSYLLLTGRCRSCRKRIPLQYLWMEIAAALAFIFALLSFPSDLLLAVSTAFIFLGLLLTSVFDLHYRQIPDLFTGVIALGGIVSAFVQGHVPSSVLGALVILLWFGSQWLLSRGRIVGSGDIFFAMAIALWLGLPRTLTMLVLSYILGALLALFLILVKKVPLRGSRVPFAPLLSIAALLAFLGVGEWYLSLLGLS